MTIRSGFSIIELLVAIGVLGIIFVLTVPNYGALQEDREHMAEVQTLFDLISEARNNAIVNLKCGNGEEARYWEARFAISSPDNLLRYQLMCQPVTGVIRNESDWTTTQHTIIARLNMITDPSFSLSDPADQLRVGFTSTSAQARVYVYNSALDSQTLIDQEFEFEFTMLDGDRNSSICMNTVGSFAEIDLYSHDCTADL